MQDTGARAFYHSRMNKGESTPTRTLTLVLPESEWKALRAAEPDALGWLRAQIEQRLSSSAISMSQTSATGSIDGWRSSEDEYN